LFPAIFGYNTTTKTYVPERFPDGFITRATPFTFSEGAAAIAAMYLDHPTIFGGNTGIVNSFNGLDVAGSILRGQPLTAEQVGAKGEGLMCLLQQAVTQGTPGLIAGIEGLPVAALNFLSANVLPVFDQFSCT
jgi:hypothetical protein